MFCPNYYRLHALKSYRTALKALRKKRLPSEPYQKLLDARCLNLLVGSVEAAIATRTSTFGAVCWQHKLDERHTPGPQDDLQ